MGPFSMVVMIVLIVMVANVLKARSRYESQRGASDGESSAETARLRGEVQQLRERIQVLERVITDNHSSVDLDRQIESLRDR